ncbi:cytochrome P450 81D1-like [Rutidosis leptorrhynchoides]|uniref:cytochrome P450 81D1-like n=1 Tax=Rutidosis leptorrhynchoides TaxID=125765 RepID=UPI003A990FDB
METLHFYILLLGLAWSIFNKYFVPKLRNLPPTPLSASAVILLRLFKQPLCRTLSQISNQHGPILLLRFGFRRVLLVSSSSAAEELFSTNDAVFANRPKLLPGKQFGCNYTTLAWAPHGHVWRHLRSVSCLEILPFHRVPNQQESFNEEIKVMLGRLLNTQEKTVELRLMFLDLVFHVMMRMFAGKRYCRNNMTAKGEVMESISLQEYVTRSFRMTTEETDVGYFMPILKLFGLKSLDQRCKKLQEIGDSLMDGLIEEIKRTAPDFSDISGDTQETVIEFLLDKQKTDPKNYSDQKIRGLVLGLMSAGTTTSSGIMEWAFSLLLSHPEVLKKAQDEIDNYIGNDRFIDQSDIDHLPYLRCIVKETMRMYPVAPLLVPHESSRECRVSGYNVPKGTMLMVNVWAIHNDPNVWTEPTKFSPERFEKTINERDGFKLMPFGYGRRSCPGKHMATRMIHLTLGSLIHCFDWERVSEKMVNGMTEKTGMALLKAQPLVARGRPRLKMEKLLSQI